MRSLMEQIVQKGKAQSIDEVSFFLTELKSFYYHGASLYDKFASSSPYFSRSPKWLDSLAATLQKVYEGKTITDKQFLSAILKAEVTK